MGTALARPRQMRQVARGRIKLPERIEMIPSLGGSPPAQHIQLVGPGGRYRYLAAAGVDDTQAGRPPGAVGGSHNLSHGALGPSGPGPWQRRTLLPL